MLERYRIYRRNSGCYYAKDKVTGKSESIGTKDKAAAKQLLVARNHGSATVSVSGRSYLHAKIPVSLDSHFRKKAGIRPSFTH